jgi:tRNA pseudouridine55 synthase
MTLPEVLLIDKPAGMTSFDVIRQLRKQTGIKKFGHAGTLDPMATGLMILGVDRGTKKLADYIKLDKVYEATILLGESYSTGDITGELVASVERVEIDEQTLKQEVMRLVGTHRLPVSAYSAIKKDGVPMYKRARAAAKVGEFIHDVPYRDMSVHDVLWRGAEEYKGKVLVHVTFHVASGVYIRSLAEELGRRVGFPATLAALRRTKVGSFSVTKAVKPSEIV